jgi:hypothetical protein
MYIQPPMTRAELQQLQEKRRKEALIQCIDNTVYHNILSSAAEGKTSHFWIAPISKPKIVFSHPPIPTFTKEELMGTLKEKFPDTTVEYQETWVETRPGVKEERKGILIDWS